MPIVRLIFVKGHGGSQDGGADLERELRAIIDDATTQLSFRETAAVK